MRGDFEVNFSGYPVAAMPSGVVKGEATVQYIPTMNKLCDAQVMSSELASQVAAFLNQQIRSEGLATDWPTLNTASLERYDAIKGKFTETAQESVPTTVGAREDNTHSLPQLDAGEAGTTSDVQVVEFKDSSTAEQGSEGLSTTTAYIHDQPAEQAEILAGIVAGANGSNESNSSVADATEPATAVPAIKPLKAPAK